MVAGVAAHRAGLVQVAPVPVVPVAVARVVRPVLAAALRAAVVVRQPRTVMPLRRMHHLLHRPQPVEAQEAARVGAVAHGAARCRRPRGLALRPQTGESPIGPATGRSRRAF